MMKRYDEQMFLGYIEDDLASDQRDQFESLMAQDPKLKRLVAQILEDRRLLHRLPAESPPHDLLEQVNQRLERNMLLDTPAPELNPAGPSHRFRMGRLITYTSLAAMVLICTAVVIHTLTDHNLYDQFTPGTGKQASVAGRSEEATPPHPLGDSAPLSTLALRSDADLLDDLTRERQIAAVSQDAPAPIKKDGVKKSDDQAEAIGRLRKVVTRTGLRIKETKAARTPTLAESIAIDAAKNEQSEEPLLPPEDTFARLIPDPPAEIVTDQARSPLAQKVLQHLKASQTLPPTAAQKSRAPQTPAPRKKQPAPSVTPAQPEPRTPGMKINVTTRNAEAGQQSVLAWAIAHTAHISALKTASPPPPDPTQPHPTTGNTGDNPPSRQIQLIMTAQQLPLLLEQLNAPPHQSARVQSQIPHWDHPTGLFTMGPLPSIGFKIGAEPPETPAPNLHTPLRKNVSHLPRFNEIDWDLMLLWRLPLQPVVPTYEPHTKLSVTIEIREIATENSDPKTPSNH